MQNLRQQDAQTSEQTPGEALKAWLELLGMSASEFSRQIPCSVSLPGQWIRGVANPSFRMACRVEQITDGVVPRTLWYPPGTAAPVNLELQHVEHMEHVKDVSV